MTQATTMTDRFTFGQSGAAYAAIGWHVGPICWPTADGACACGYINPKTGQRGHVDKNIGKAPLTTGGFKGFTNNPSLIDRWLVERPDWQHANTGIDVERAGFLVVDADGQDGIVEVLSWFGGSAPDCPTVSTGKGFHYYFKLPEGAPATRAIHAGASGEIDILSAGYAILPQSHHKSGRVYKWVKPPQDFTAARPIPEAPQQAIDILVAALAKRTQSTDDHPVILYAAGDPPVQLTAVERDLWDGRRFVAGTDGARDRSETIFALATAFAKHGLTVEEIASAIGGWDARQSDPKYHGRRDSDRRYRQTAQNAYDRVQNELTSARLISDDADDEVGSPSSTSPVNLIIDDGDDGAPAAKPAAKKRGRPRRAASEDGEGEDAEGDKESAQHRWMRRYLETPAYQQTAFGLGHWRRYEAGLWKRIPPEQVEQELIKLMGDFVSMSMVNNVANLVKRKNFRPVSHWNRNRDILVTGNVVVDLLTGESRPHSAGDWATVGVPYDYDQEATAPAWETILSRLPGEPGNDIQSYIEEYMGYCLTARMNLEHALWFVSKPGQGKSTFIEGFQTVLGEEIFEGDATPMEDRDLLVGKLSLSRLADRFALANIPGKRLLVATEQPGVMLDGADALNAMISGEPTDIEQKNQPIYTIRPTTKFAWAMNDLPRVPNANNGIFRRVHIVNVPDIVGKIDKTLKYAVRKEGAGMLNRALAGLRRLLARGDFELPTSVRAADEKFKRSNDVPGLFLDEWCVTAPARTKGAPYAMSGALYAAYRNYCKTHGYQAVSQKRLAGDWDRLGLVPVTVKGSPAWSGVGLRSDVAELNGSAASAGLAAA